MVHNSLPRMWWLAKGQKHSQHYNPGDIDTLNQMDYYWNFFLAFKHSLNVNLVYTWVSFQVTIQVDCVWNRYFLFLTCPTAFFDKTRFCAFVPWKWICKSACDSFSDVGEIRVYFAGKILTPCRMHWNAFLIAQIIAKCHSFPNM